MPKPQPPTVQLKPEQAVEGDVEKAMQAGVAYVRRWNIRGLDLGDLESIALEVAVVEARRFVPGKYALESVVVHHLRGRLARMKRDAARKSQMADDRRGEISIDFDRPVAQPEAWMLERTLALMRLTDRQRRIAEMISQGYCPEEVGRLLKIGRTTIWREIAEMRSKLATLAWPSLEGE